MMELKTPKDIVKVLCREMTAYGQGWRLDWNGFDGRQLRDQLNALARWADRALYQLAAEKPVVDYTDGTAFLADRIQ